MKNFNFILSIAKSTILLESKAIANLTNLIDINFEKAVKFILNSNGCVIVTGIGKSANIATKDLVTNTNKNYIRRVVHLHNLIKEGIF